MDMPFSTRRSIFFLLVLITFAAGGCTPANPHQTQGAFGPVAQQQGCISGRITDSITGRPVADVQLKADALLGVALSGTNEDGFFYAELPPGNHRLLFVKNGYQEAEWALALKKGEVADREISLRPSAPLVVDAGKSVTGAKPGSTIALRAKATTTDGTPPGSITWRWEQELTQDGVVAELTAKGAELAVTLPDARAYRRALLHRLEKEGRLRDRWMAVGVTPADLRATGRVTLKVTASSSSNTYSDTIDIMADLSSVATVSPGLTNVPIGRPVLLHGVKQSAYRWWLHAPAGSRSQLKDADSSAPSFIPDIPGWYAVGEGERERVAVVAGSWSGAIVAKETESRDQWVGLRGCNCHTKDDEATRFRLWRSSGHAGMFTRCVNTVFRYQQSCFPCHAVGSADPTPDGLYADKTYQGFLQNETFWNLQKVPHLVRPRPGNFDYLLDSYPEVARFGNIQCENCHGPNNSAAHKELKKTGAPERISLAAEVCGVCHDPSAGDPTFQQWEEGKKHADYDLAVRVATVESQGELAADCGRCHTAQGFLVWAARGQREARLASNSASAGKELAAIGLTREKAHPITCAVCHEPHNPGSTFRTFEKVSVRKTSSRLLPREFSGLPAGRGELCVTCHSTIWGSYNDQELAVIDSDIVPHVGQGDVLFGQNAFFVKVGLHKSHARIEDTCVWCHVKAVPANTAAYPRRGANHTFRADPGACGKCHDFAGEELAGVTERDLQSLEKAIEDALGSELKQRGKLSKAGAPLNLVASGKPRLTESERSMAVQLETTDGSRTVPLAQLQVAGQPLLSTEYGQVLVKASWNYFLLKRDGSKGAHNPQFVREVLKATLKLVQALRRQG